MDKNTDCFGTDIEAVITSFNQGTMILEAVESLCAQTILLVLKKLRLHWY